MISADAARELAARLARGDQDALAESYERYSGRCRDVAFRVLHDDALAEDAVQEAFASLWRRREGLVVRSAGIAPWLIVVTRNAALTLLRADTRRRLREDREAVDSTSISGEPDPSVIVSSDDAAAQVRAALDGLPPEQRDVIRLAYFERLTLAQIAERSGAPLGTVKRRAQLALARLAKILNGGGL
ncbi:MAG TPA: RNA polymerase sigma factor [Candidatus Eremiobacteraceae bacterium]|nr:RNA polymerase sigma factor [Candidatus Eremiobacteraceae bacterium]